MHEEPYVISNEYDSPQKFKNIMKNFSNDYLHHHTYEQPLVQSMNHKTPWEQYQDKAEMVYNPNGVKLLKSTESDFELPALRHQSYNKTITQSMPQFQPQNQAEQILQQYDPDFLEFKLYKIQKQQALHEQASTPMKPPKSKVLHNESLMPSLRSLQT